MIDFIKKAERVESAGKLNRGNFEPPETPMNIYNYWLLNSNGMYAWEINNEVRQENFCHFWRVVFIWAPLVWLATKTTRKIDWPSISSRSLFKIQSSILLLILITFIALVVSILIKNAIAAGLIASLIAIGEFAVIVLIMSLFVPLFLFIIDRFLISRMHSSTAVNKDKSGLKPLRVTADMLVFVGQVIKVKKWKICPLVEIEKK